MNTTKPNATEILGCFEGPHGQRLTARETRIGSGLIRVTYPNGSEATQTPLADWLKELERYTDSYGFKRISADIKANPHRLATTPHGPSISMGKPNR